MVPNISTPVTINKFSVIWETWDQTKADYAFQVWLCMYVGVKYPSVLVWSIHINSASGYSETFLFNSVETFYHVNCLKQLQGACDYV